MCVSALEGVMEAKCDLATIDPFVNCRIKTFRKETKKMSFERIKRKKKKENKFKILAKLQINQN